MSGSGFPPATEQDWRALATRGGEIDLSALTAKSDDGLPIGPIYPAGDGPPLRGRPPGARWTAVQRIDAADGSVGEVARAAVSGGATGLSLVFADSAAARGRGLAPDPAILARLVRDTPLPGLELRIEVGDVSLGAVEPAVAALADAGPSPVSLAFDPAATLAARGALSRSVEDTSSALLTAFVAMRESGVDGRLIAGDGRPWHDGGASEAQELAAVLAAVVALLRRAEQDGGDLSRLAPTLGVLVAADADQFLTIAKLRAMRLLLARVMELSGLPEATPRVEAETAWRMMARRDPTLNMLRTTAAALAAALGGADSVTVLPFDLGGDGFAARMARNIQTIALDESALFRVGDPGAGSGAIESLTAGLAGAAWEEFRAIEAEGGLSASVRAGAIQTRVAAKRAERLGKVARREIEIVGVNVHVDRGRPLPPPTAPAPLPAPDPAAVETATPLAPARLAEPFERLCDKAARLAATGRLPPVFVAGLGPPAAWSEAAGLAADVLAAGGINSTLPAAFETPAAMAASFRDSRAVAACIATGPGVSDARLADSVSALKAQNSRFVLVCGPGHHGGADALLGTGSDVPEMLDKLLDMIAIDGKNGQNPEVL